MIQTVQVSFLQVKPGDRLHFFILQDQSSYIDRFLTRDSDMGSTVADSLCVSFLSAYRCAGWISDLVHNIKIFHVTFLLYYAILDT